MILNKRHENIYIYIYIVDKFDNFYFVNFGKISPILPQKKFKAFTRGG